MTGAVHPEDVVEAYRQRLLWGEVQFDTGGRVVRREEPEHWKSLRAAHVSGRGWGKTARVQAAMDGTRAAIAWLDEHVAVLAAAWDEKDREVRELVRRSDLATPPVTVPEIGSVRWPHTPATLPVFPEPERWHGDILDLIIRAKQEAR